jgi:hypothetical protein
MAITDGVQSDLDEDTLHTEIASEESENLPNPLGENLEFINPQADHFKIVTKAYTQIILSNYGPAVAQISKKLDFEILNSETIKWLFHLLIELGYYEAVYGVQSAQYSQAQQKYRDYYRQIEEGTDVGAKKLLKFFDSQEDQGKQSLLRSIREDSVTIIRQIAQNIEG